MIEQDRPGKIFVGGLTGNVDKETLENSFAKYGRITEILIIRDKITNQSRGFGFITYENPLDAEDAVKGMDGETINGKEVHVEPAVASLHDERDSDRGLSSRSSRGGIRRGSSSLRSRGSRGGLMSRRGGFVSSRDSGRRDLGRRSSPPSRRGSLGMRSRGRGGPPLRGRSSMISRRDLTPPRKGPLLHSSSQRFSDGQSLSRRTTYNDSPPRRFSSDFDRRDDRFTSSSYSDRIPTRSRDVYSPPPRETSRGLLDSRMSSGRVSRDYQVSRDYMQQRSHTSRAISPEPIRRIPVQRDSYTTSGRDDRRDSYRSSNASRDYIPSRSSGMAGDYISSRDSGREYTSSRDYGSSRDYQTSRDPPSRDYGGRFDSHDIGSSSSRYMSREIESRSMPSRGSSQRGYDSYADVSSSRSYSGPGSRAPPSRAAPSFSSHGGSTDRRDSRGDSSGLAGIRRSGPPPSRGPPPLKRSRMDGASMKREGPPMRR